jgi:hypothetical protein
MTNGNSMSLRIGVISVAAASSRDEDFKETSFCGWKPLPRKVGVKLMTWDANL